MNIFTKLFLLLAVLSTLPLGVATVVLVRESGALQEGLLAKSSETGEKTSQQSADALEQQAERSHLQIIVEKAIQIQGFFDNIRRAVLLESTLVSHALRVDPPKKSPPLHRAEWIADRLAEKGVFAKEVHSKKPYSGYHLAPDVEKETVNDTLQRIRQLGYFFSHNQRALPWCISTYIGTHDGVIIGYPGRSKYPKEYDPRKRPWYISAAKAGHLIWTDLYLDRNKIDLVITCANPVYRHPERQKATKLGAVAAIDVKLTQIVEHLFDLRGFHVSDAVLTDGVELTSRVIVSRAYTASKERSMKKDQSQTAQLNRISQLPDRRFREVFRRIKERLTQGKRWGILPMPAAKGDSGGGAMFTYATIAIQERSYDGTGRDRNWFYVVKSPLDDIIAPVEGIRRVHKASQKELSHEISQKVRRLWNSILIFSLVVLVFALAAAFFTARSSTRPLVEMASAAQAIGRGDLDQHVSEGSKDEVGQLARAINEMVVGLKDRDFIRSTFKNYVAGSVVDELLENPEKLKMGGDRMQLTVFFSDLASFTSLSESLSPEDLISLINNYLGAMTEAILEHEGTVDKYEGDAIMAFWGAPRTQEDHALKACRAALDNQRRLKELWVEWEAQGIQPLDMRIGINTGPMVVGNVGSPQLKNYTVMGDAVNLGSRLEGVNKVYGTRILISEDTRKLIHEELVTREIDLIAVKGKSEAVRVYELIGSRDDVDEVLLEATEQFEAGLKAYRQRDWDAAEAAFRAALDKRPEDRAARVFLERIALFRESSPADGWDGTFTMTVK